MHVPIAVVPAVGALVAVSATGAPVVAHGRDPDVVNLAAGLVLLVAGAQLMAVWQTRTAGSLLVLTSVTWFLPDLAPDVPLLGPLLAASSLAHVVPLVGAVLVAPEGRLGGHQDRVVVALAIVAGASAVTGGYQVLVPACGVALLGSAVMTMARAARRRGGRAALAHVVAVLAVTGALAGVPLARATFAGGQEDWLFAGYAGLLALAAVSLVGVGAGLRSTAALDVGPDALATLDDLLAEATGDRRAHAVVRLDDGRWVRLDGRPAPATPGTDEAALVVAATAVPASLRGAIAEGLRLAGENVRSRQVLEERVRELVALRSRLVRLEDVERAALVDRLRSGPLTALVELRRRLESGGAPAELLEHVQETERDVEQVAAGLDPRDRPASAADAIRRLADQMGARADVPPATDVDATAGRALWYACSEALTNSAKHAPGAARRVGLAVGPSQVVLVVSDDGPGPGRARGSGLVGVRDRVAAVGGTVVVTDQRPGTRVEVRIPSRRQHLLEPGSGADVPDTEQFLASGSPTMEALP
jgi:hypothetical protein